MALLIPPTDTSRPQWVRAVATAVNELLRRVGVFGLSATYSADAAASPQDYLMLMDASSGPVVATLPPSVPRQIVVKKIDASANPVIINPDGAETIDGASSISITAQWQSYTLMGIAGGWAIL